MESDPSSKQERKLAYAREYARKRRADPTVRERQAAYSRQRYKDIKADPERLAELRRKERERRARRLAQDPEFNLREFERGRRRTLGRRGLTEEDFAGLAEIQKQRCAVCNRKAPLCVDHCHRTNKVRGLLCNNCNSALGFLQEDVNRMQALINYTAKCHE